MADDISSQLDQINKLAPEARARVSNALKATVSAELSGLKPGIAAGEFSKGAFFSRSKDNPTLDENQIVEHAASMDADKFATFVQNLQSVKSLKGTPGS